MACYAAKIETMAENQEPLIVIPKRALISTSDKTGLLPLASVLQARGIEIIASGGSAEVLRTNGITVTDVCDYTGYPEMMDGRVKTLHPKIHGGILGRRGQDDALMTANHILPIDLVIVNLYPFAKTIAAPNCSFDLAIEQIDIGGPTLIRAAAKNFIAVTVVVDPADYALLLADLEKNQGTSATTREQFAAKAFQHTAHYDAVIANYFAHRTSKQVDTALPPCLTPNFIKRTQLRYGENPHQNAAFYVDPLPKKSTLATAKLHSAQSVFDKNSTDKKALSYNNLADADAALECLKNLGPLPACVIVKHANPCGVAIRPSILEAYQAAYLADPTSAFGGIIALNQPLDATIANAILTQQFVEVLIVPGVLPSADAVLMTKPNVRVLVCDPWLTSATATSLDHATPLEYKRISGGLLVQTSDDAVFTPSDNAVVTKRKPTDDEWQDLLFAWQIVKYVKSNAIVYAKDQMTIGIGAGQMSRIYSVEIANMKAQAQNLSTIGAVMASDAFFPFADSIDAAKKAGISAIIQPGGSIRDADVIAAANKADISMVLTQIRHFRH